jgi:peptidoglycan hydrolase CwlO-like protein
MFIQLCDTNGEIHEKGRQHIARLEAAETEGGAHIVRLNAALAEVNTHLAQMNAREALASAHIAHLEAKAAKAMADFQALAAEMRQLRSRRILRLAAVMTRLGRLVAARLKRA